MKRRSIALLVWSLLLGGCGMQQAAEEPKATMMQGAGGQAETPAAPTETPGPRDEDARKSEPAFDASDVDPRVVEANNAFAFELFRDVSNRDEKGGNIILSPVSATIALSMTMNGGKGETLEGMKRALGMDNLDMEEVNRSLQALADILRHSGEGVRLDIANSLWADKGRVFLELFLEANRTYYDAEVTDVDLQSEEALSRINGWVSERTEGKIEKLLDSPLSEDAILLLMNAIYFDANWAAPFDEEATAPHPFRSEDGSVRETPTMFRHGKLLYADGDGYEAVRLPYLGGSLGMYLFVPDEGTPVSSLVDRLSPETWDKWTASFGEASGRLGLPKFRVEYETSLNEPLKALGMELAFDRGNADFRAMIDLPETVFISEVKQKTYVDVAEKGTLAAAVTGVTVETASAPSKTFDLVADRPFLFAIHDDRTDSILFMGAIRDPS